MLKRILMIVVAAAVWTALIPPASAYADFEYECGEYSGGRCRWTLISSGTQPVVTDAEYIPPAGSGIPDPCRYQLLSPQPDPDDEQWGGNDPAHGRMWYSLCPDGNTEESWDGSGNRIVHYIIGSVYYVADGDTPDGASAASDPMTLVERARGAFVLPVPTPAFGPDAATVAVKVPVWLSTQPFDPIVETATAGRLTAEVSAELVDTVWQMGEPRDPAVPGSRTAPVVCAGSGAAFGAGMNPGAPPCGYTYIWRSLSERTAGTGTWPVTVTSRYTISWTVTGGAGTESGSDSVETTATVPLQVREWHSILIDHVPE